MIEKIPNEWRYRDSETKMFYPWYTKPCLEWLVTLDLEEKRVFEYGIGDSTTWYHKAGCRVFGAEMNKVWADKFGYFVAHDKQEYIESSTYSTDLYHIIVIDGDFRDDCTEYALKALKPGGFLIIDNWMQPSVEMNWAKTEKLIEGLPIAIYKEPDHYDWQTAVITKL